MGCGERLRQELRASGFRVTPQRGVILETIAHLPEHPSVLEVYQAARSRLPGLNLATVYRTLDTLSQAGLLDLMEGPDDLVHCSIRDPNSLHGHLICRRCQAVVEVEMPLLLSLSDEIARRHGFALDVSHLTLSGLCSSCQQAAADSTLRRQ